MLQFKMTYSEGYLDWRRRHWLHSSAVPFCMILLYVLFLIRKSFLVDCLQGYLIYLLMLCQYTCLGPCNIDQACITAVIVVAAKFFLHVVDVPIFLCVEKEPLQLFLSYCVTPCRWRLEKLVARGDHLFSISIQVAVIALLASMMMNWWCCEAYDQICGWRIWIDICADGVWIVWERQMMNELELFTLGSEYISETLWITHLKSSRSDVNSY